MKPKELARLLGYTVAAVYSQLRQGHIKGHKDDTGHWTIDEDDPLAAYWAHKIEASHRNPIHPGDRFGHWTVLEMPDYKQKRVRCQCDCGRIRYVFLPCLYNGKSTSCGCQRYANPSEGQKAGHDLGYEVSRAIHKQKLAVKYLGKKVNRNSSTGHTGVCWRPRDHKYFAYITVNRKQIGLGLYDGLDDAIAARAAAEDKYYAERQAKVNEIKAKTKKDLSK